MISLNTGNFDKVVTQADKPTIIVFTASWCSPCQHLLANLATVEKERPDLQFATVDVDKTNTALLVKNHMVMSIPHTYVYDGKHRKGQVVGLVTNEKILSFLEAKDEL